MLFSSWIRPSFHDELQRRQHHPRNTDSKHGRDRTETREKRPTTTTKTRRNSWTRRRLRCLGDLECRPTVRSTCVTHATRHRTSLLQTTGTAKAPHPPERKGRQRPPGKTKNSHTRRRPGSNNRKNVFSGFLTRTVYFSELDGMQQYTVRVKKTEKCFFRFFDPNRIFQRARTCSNIRFGSRNRKMSFPVF